MFESPMLPWRSKNYYIPECVFVAVFIQHAKRMCHIAICGLPCTYNIFPHYLINGKNFGNKLLNTKAVSFDRLYKFDLKL